MALDDSGAPSQCFCRPGGFEEEAFGPSFSFEDVLTVMPVLSPSL